MSNIGEEIRIAWERKIGRTITCTTCLNYLRGLGSGILDDHAAFVLDLYKNLPFPTSVSKRLTMLESQRLIVDTIRPVMVEAGLPFELAEIAILNPTRRQSRRSSIPLIVDRVNLWKDEPNTEGQPRVGFLSAAYLEFGGTETFHRTLIPRLQEVVNVIGFVATGHSGGDGASLQVRYATGIEAARDLAVASDIVVTWGIDDLKNVLPVDRPKVIAVHHADLSSDWSEKTILRQLDVIDSIVCVNPDVAKHLMKHRKPVHYIPNAVDPERIIPSGNQHELRSRHTIHEQSRIVLFGHRMSFEKRPGLAVDIARCLPSDWVMVIAGDGSEKRNVDLAAQTCDKVRIVGHCDSLADWLSISDCFLSLSTFEGFGLSVCEAIMAGVPTVSTPTGIAPGLAITLPTESPAEAWADAIVNAQQVATPEQIADLFSIDRMVAQWVDVLKSQWFSKRALKSTFPTA